MATMCLIEGPNLMERTGGNVLICDQVLMLTLDPTTLFYLSLMETSKPKTVGLIDSWAVEVSAAGLPLSKKSNKPASIRSIPSLTIGSTRSTSTSVLTNRVAITSAEPQVIDISDDEFGFPDEDETKGPERDAAVASPPKGKKRVTSSVSICSLRFLIITDNLIRRSSKSKTCLFISMSRHRRRNFETRTSPVAARTKIAGARTLSPPSYGILPIARQTLGI